MKSIDVLLVNPGLATVSTTPFYTMPIGLLSIASYLQQSNFNVEVVDLNTTKKGSDSSPKLIGVSVMVAGQLQTALKFLRYAKLLDKTVVTILGGAHVSQFPKEILENCPFVDFIVIGEGEEQALACAEYAKTKIEPKVWPDGLAYRKDNQIIVKTKKSYIADLNTLPNPAYDLVEFSNYLHDTSSWHNPYKQELGVRVPIITSRGCPNVCNFCSVAKCMGLSYRPLTASRVVDLIESIQQKHNARYFAIYDANFTEDPKRVVEICNEIKKRSIKIILDLPTGFPINAFSTEMIESLIEVGLIRTGVSIESGDDYIRNKVMKKNIKQEDIFTVINAMRKFKHVFFLADLVIGMPEDTKESLDISCEIVEELDIDDIILSIATPYPGTALYEQCIKDNLFFENIDTTKLWKADWLSHDNLQRFTIKPYNLDMKTLQMYRDKILKIRSSKISQYHSRMKEYFNISSNYIGR